MLIIERENPVGEIKKIQLLRFRLGYLKVTELKLMIDEFHLQIPKAQKKAELIEAICQCIMEQPFALTFWLRDDELDMLEEAINGGEDAYVLETGIEGYYNRLLNFSILLVERTEDPAKLRILIDDELKSIFEKYQLDRTIGSVMKAVRLIIGMATLNGILWPEEAVERVNEILPDAKLDAITAVSNLMNAGLSGMLIIDEERQEKQKYPYMIVSPWFIAYLQAHGFPDYHLDPMSQPLKQFSEEEIYAAGDLLWPEFPNKKEVDALRTILTKRLGLSAYAAEKLLIDLYIAKNTTEVGMNEIQSLMPPLRSIEDANVVLSAFLEFANTVPYAKFRGRSSKEVFEQEERHMKHPPRLVAGPNMRAMGMDIPGGLQDRLNEVWTGRKVGRNDPCPYGSGKKYKHCCGR